MHTGLAAKGNHRVTARLISIAATNRVGRRIRHDGLTPANREALELVLQDAFNALNDVSVILRRDVSDVAFTPRLKTLGTIVEKLEREPTMALSRMRDVAGIRLVDDMSRLEQDVLVQRIREALGGGTIVDRRYSPSHGYRAVHLEVDRGCAFVEIQVRTGLQDQWAQIVERLGDAWGRGIRYGRGPDQPDASVGRTEVSRRDLWDTVVEMSELVDLVESNEFDATLATVSDADERRIETATSRRNLTGALRNLALITDRMIDT